MGTEKKGGVNNKAVVKELPGKTKHIEISMAE